MVRIVRTLLDFDMNEMVGIFMGKMNGNCFKVMLIKVFKIEY